MAKGKLLINIELKVFHIDKHLKQRACPQKSGKNFDSFMIL